MSAKEKNPLHDYVKSLITSNKTQTVEHDMSDRFFNKNINILQGMINESLKDEKFPIGLPISATNNESISMRSRLINWLRQVNNYRSSKPGVLAITVAIIDRFCYYVSQKKSEFRVSGENYQYIGAAAYHLASKLEEVSPITSGELARFTKDSCTSQDIQDLELMMSIELKFNTRFTTPIDIISLLVTFMDKFVKDKIQLEDLARIASDLYISVIGEYALTQYANHVIAVTAIVLAYFEADFYERCFQDDFNEKLLDLCQIPRATIMSCYECFSSFLPQNGSEESPVNDEGQ